MVNLLTSILSTLHLKEHFNFTCYIRKSVVIYFQPELPELGYAIYVGAVYSSQVRFNTANLDTPVVWFLSESVMLIFFKLIVAFE